jgi:hypothetical protein
MSYSKGTIKLLGKYSNRSLLLNKYANMQRISIRQLGILPIFGRLLKLRYLFLGTAVGGGVAIHNVSDEPNTVDSMSS